MSNTLQKLVASVTEDGTVDAAEVTALRSEIFADGVVDRAEANALFEINDRVSGADNVAAYQDLFVEAISSHVLNDENSPGEIDDDEAAWLIEKIEGDGTVDGVELALARNIAAKATSVPASLSAKFAEWGVSV